MFLYWVPAIRLVLRFGRTAFWFIARNAVWWVASELLDDLREAYKKPQKRDELYKKSLNSMKGDFEDYYRVTFFQLVKELVVGEVWDAFVDYARNYIRSVEEADAGLIEVAKDVVEAN